VTTKRLAYQEVQSNVIPSSSVRHEE